MCYALFPYTTLFRSRAQGLVGAESHRALLDPLGDSRSRRSCDPEGAMNVALERASPRLASHAAHGRAVVVGLGRTGLSCARFLRARGVEFAVTDNRAAPPEAAALKQLAPETETRFGEFEWTLLEGASQITVSPGVSGREPFVARAAERGLPIVGDIELFAREARAPVAAITGTNGKSTVTTLVARMAERSGRRTL